MYIRRKNRVDQSIYSHDVSWILTAFILIRYKSFLCYPGRAGHFMSY